MNTAKYVCLRFFIVPLEEHLFTRPVPDAQKMAWFRDAFLENRDYVLGVQEYAVRITDRQDDVAFGKLSKRRYHETHPKTDSDIEDVVTEDWPYLEFACDSIAGRQILVIEENSTVIYKSTVVKEVIEALVNPPMFLHGYAVRFEPIVDDTSFWGLVESSDCVFSLTFMLNSPNLFGASSSANEALRRMQGLFNNTRLKVTFDNERGDLKVPREEIETYRDYADRGGGEWTITTKAKGKGRKKRKHSSAQRALKITAEKEGNQTIIERLRSVFMGFADKAK